MDLTIYDVILGPVMTDKAYKLNRNLKKLVLRVHPSANKPLVKEALESLFEVKVKSVRTVIRKGKVHRFRGTTVKKPLNKIAIVTLKEGHSIDIWEQPGVSVATSEGPKKADAVDKSTGND